MQGKDNVKENFGPENTYIAATMGKETMCPP